MPSRARLPLVFLAGCLLALAAALLLGLSSRHVRPGAVDLDAVVPQRFGAWREMPTPIQAVDPAITGDGAVRGSDLYDHISTKTYRRSDGATVVLTLAYRRVQLEESKIHRPELCYFALGFALSDPARVPVTLATGPFDALSFVAMRGDQAETVLYLIRIGDRVSTSAWQTRWRLFGLSLRGIVPDGILIRASVVGAGRPDAARIAANRRILASFIDALVIAPEPGRRWILDGGAGAFSQLDRR